MNIYAIQSGNVNLFKENRQKKVLLIFNFRPDLSAVNLVLKVFPPLLISEDFLH